MSQQFARGILLKLIKTHQNFIILASGEIYSLDQILTILKGRKVEADEAMEVLNSLQCSTA